MQLFFLSLCLHLCLTHIIKNSFIASFPAEELTEAGILLVIDGVVIVSVATDSGLPGEGSVLAERGEQCARSPSQRLHLQVSLPLAL